MDDRTLLELAAKAAGIRLEWDGDPTGWQPVYYEGKTYHAWNPLADDGDALRLAVKLGMQIDARSPETRVYAPIDDVVTEYHKPDAATATRRAIVRAAAALGQQEAQG